MSTEYISWETIREGAQRVRDNPDTHPAGLVADYITDAVHVLAPWLHTMNRMITVARQADTEAAGPSMNYMEMVRVEDSPATTALLTQYRDALRRVFEQLADLHSVEEAAQWAAHAAVGHLTTTEHGVDYSADGVLRWRIHAALGSPTVRDPVKARAAEALVSGRNFEQAGALVGVSKAAISQALKPTSARH